MDLFKHIQKAEEALRRRNYDFAIELYRQLLDLDADLGPARAGLRRALQKRHQTRRGGGLLRSVGGAVPLARAKALLKLRRHAAAANALEDYLAQNPLDEEANLLLGRALESAGHFQSACAVFEFLAEIAPRNPEGLKSAGAMMRHTGNPRRALEYYERALEADPRDRDALKARKDLAAETALSDTRIEHVGHSRELIKDKEKARSLEREGRRHRSEQELRDDLAGLQTSAGQDGDPATLLEIAAAHERLGELDVARETVERVLALGLDSPALVARAGDLRSQLLKKCIARASKAGDESTANRLEAEHREFEVGDYRRRVELSPGDAALRLQLGKRLLRRGDLDAAVVELQKANLDPRLRTDALFLLGQCFQRKGFLDLARSQYATALGGLSEMSDRKKEILYNLGSISEMEGDAAVARSFYVRIYEVDIGYRDVAEKMEELK